MKVISVRSIAVGALAAIGLGSVVGVASSYYHHASGDRVFAFSKPAAIGMPPVLTPAGPTGAPLRALAVIQEGTTYDFGVMSRNEQRSHTFVLENQGTAPLAIRYLDKSCMCTDVSMTRNDVPPGESTEITITWQPSTFNLDFQQSARFETNDPARIELDLTVKGKVQQVVQASPRSLSFDGVSAGQERKQMLHVFSYRDADLCVDRAELLDPETAPYFETAIEPVDDTTLAEEPGAVAGQQITVRLKPGLSLGRSYQRLRLHLNKPELGPLEIPMIATIVGNITLLGPGYDAHAGVWDLGKLPGNQDHTKTLWILVNGEDADTVQLSVDSVDPADALQVELTSSGSINLTSSGSINKIARHALKLTIRPQGRVLNRLGSDQGDLAEVVIKTTHPDVPLIRIPIAFAIETLN